MLSLFDGSPKFPVFCCLGSEAFDVGTYPVNWGDVGQILNFFYIIRKVEVIKIWKQHIYGVKLADIKYTSE